MAASPRDDRLPEGSQRIDSPRHGIRRLIGPFRRRRAWKAISDQSGLRLPGLELPRLLGLMIMAIAFAPFVGALVVLENSKPAILLLIAAPFIFIALVWLAQPFATVPPRQILIMRDLVRTVVGLNHGKLVQEFGPSTDDELRKALECVVRDISGADYYWLEGEDFPLSNLVCE